MMKKNNINENSFADLLKSAKSTSYAPLSKSVCAAMLAGAMVLGGGVFVSPAPAYADGYVSPDGNNIYYGYKSDADYSKDRIKIEVHYYSNMKDAEDDNIANQDPLGKFVHVKYTANLNDKQEFDRWAFRPMWWYGVPAGLTDVHDINYSRFEKYTGDGNPVPSRPGLHREDENVTKHYANSKDWKGISNFYITDPSKLTSMNGLKTLLGIDGKQNNGYDKTGNTAGNWGDYYDATKGMQGMFVDWESAGKRFYQMTYVAELTDKAWKERNEHPLRFAAGVYRFAGNWHIATGQTHHAPKIADSLKVQYPALTPVAKADSLTPDEKTNVTTAINKANENTKHFSDLLEKIDVANDGTATLTFKDNTTIKMPGKLLVVEEKKDNVKFPPVYPAPMGVVNPQKLSTDDQKAIIKGFKDANKGKEFLKKVSTTDSDVYKFDNNKQELTITYTDGSTITVPYSSLVYQGAKISDWAPYVVPDPIEVKDLSKLDQTEQKKVTDAFDTANADLDVYTAAKKDSKTPVSFDSGFKNAIITWADGSTSTIPSWQFLKKKPEQAPSPKPPTPKPTEEKTFIVDVPQTQTVVKFDPFKTTEQEINAGNAKTQLDSLKTVLAKYVKDSATKQKVDGVTVTYSVDNNGVGQVTFSKQGYTSKTYPMGIFFKNSPQSPASNPTTESKTHTDTTDQKNTFTYNVTKIEYDGEKPTAQDAAKALKQFVKDNYDNVSDSDLQHVTSEVAVGANWKPKANTKNMGSYDASGSNYGPMMSFSIAGNDFGIKVHGRPWDPDADNGPDWNSSMDMDLFTIKPDELYVKKAGAQQQDSTLDKLKQQAKDLLKKRTGAPDNLTNKDLKKAGIADPANLNDSSKGIDKMDEKALRDLIQKLTDAKHYDRKYNTPTVEVDDPNSLTADNFKAAVKAFLEANYDNATDVNVTSTSDFTLPTNLTPKKDTVYMEVGDYGVTKISKVSKDGIVVVDGDGKTTFTVKPTYKKKGTKPTPTPGDDKQLQEMKKQAKELIDRNPKLTEEQKEDFKNQIDNADTKEKIQDILKKANEQAGNNNVKPGDIKKKENEEKEKREKEKREKEQQNKLAEDKTKAKEALNSLSNLTTDGDSSDKNKLSGEIDKAKTSEDVKKILEKAKAINDARGALKEGALPFLSHGNANSDDDKALKELIGADPAKKDSTLTDLENAIKDISNAQTSTIRAALDAATRKNGINEQAARQAANAKIAEFENKLEAAEKVLNDNTTIKAEDKTKATTDIATAKSAITTAKESVKKATKPSEMLTQLTNVETKFKDADGKVNDAVNNAQKENKKQNTNDPDATTFQSEKDKAKKEIDGITDLTPAEKQKYKDQINDSTHKGDPEAIVNQAKKHKKIEAALKAIDNFEHLNNAQKEAFKRIIEDTDASDHKNADGTTSDDIDDALANAANTDNAMARLEKLKEIADKFAKGDKYKGLQEGNEQKKAFDAAATAAGAVLDKAKGDPKNADQVNELYKDLLKAMRDIDPDAKSAGLKTDALKNEIDSDNKLKPDDKANPKTAGDSVYTTASADKKTAFDKALNEATTVLNGADTADISDADKEATEQNEIDAALDKLIKARLALDGVNTKPLQDEIDKDSKVKNSDKYTYASNNDKKTAFDKALKDAKDLIEKLTGKKQAAQGDNLDTKENKQKALDDALAKLKAAEEALDGTKPVEPTPTPTPSVDKSHLQQGIDNGSDVHNSDDYNNAPSDKKQAYDHALDHANEVNNDPNATQDQVNQATEDLKKAEHDLKPAPTPSPVPGGAGFGVNDNAPTTVDKGELNIQIDSAEADSQPGNAGAGNNNAGNNNAGNANANAANANNNAANGANSAAVNAAVENSPAVKQADAQVAKAQAALDSALAEAKKVAADPNATQAQVDAAAQKLSAARKALAEAKAHAAQVRASVRAQVLKSGVSKLSKTGSNVSVIGLFAAVAAAGAAFFVAKRRGISRHSNN